MTIARLLVVAGSPAEVASECRAAAEEYEVDVAIEGAACSALDAAGFEGLVVEIESPEEGPACRSAVTRAGVPVALVAGFWLPPVPWATTISGRDDGFRWAIRHLAATLAWPPKVFAYGDDISQVGDLRVPDGPGPHPVVMLVHGGGWRSHWGRDLMDPLAVDLASRGFATWNVEYRRAGPTGGGWPATFLDVAAATDALCDMAERAPLYLERLVMLGHSAGGQLSLCVAASAALKVVPRLVVALASVFDMADAARRNLSRAAVPQFLGGSSSEMPDRYRAASPAGLLPIGVPQLLVHGSADGTVPVDMSETYAPLARAAGDQVELHIISGADHMQLVESRWSAWPMVAERIEALLEAG